MKIYFLKGGTMEMGRYYTGKTEALKVARAMAKETPKGETVDVDEIELADVPVKTLVMEILNNGEWLKRAETIHSVKGKKKPPKKPSKKQREKTQLELEEEALARDPNAEPKSSKRVWREKGGYGYEYEW